MNKPYWGLWSLLLVALVFFAFLSLWQDGITVGGLEIKTASFAQDLGVVDPENTNGSGNTDTLKNKKRVSKKAQVDDWRAPMDTTAKDILFIGDSMLEGLAPRLAK